MIPLVPISSLTCFLLMLDSARLSSVGLYIYISYHIIFGYIIFSSYIMWFHPPARQLPSGLLYIFVGSGMPT